MSRLRVRGLLVRGALWGGRRAWFLRSFWLGRTWWVGWGLFIGVEWIDGGGFVGDQVCKAGGGERRFQVCPGVWGVGTGQ